MKLPKNGTLDSKFRSIFSQEFSAKVDEYTMWTLSKHLMISIVVFISFQTIIAQSGKNDDENAALFRFKLQTGEVLTVDKYQDIRIFNGYLWQTREEKNRIILKVNKSAPDGARLMGNFLTYSRSPRRTGSFHFNQSWQSDFVVQQTGQYIVSDQYTMPNLRSMPTFPKTAIKPGENWNAKAQELLDMAGMKFLIPVNVQYHYKGKEILNVPHVRGQSYDRFNYKYTLNFPVKTPGSQLQRISGFTVCALWFNQAAGIPVYDSCRLVYDFHLAGGAHQEFLFRIESWYNKKQQINDLEKDDIIKTIAEDLDQNQKNQLNVRKNEQGIVLELGDILFDFNKSTLTPAAQNTIKQVAEILKKHPDKEIRILGHTDSSGNPAYNQTLSTFRAKNVLDTLKHKHNIDGTNMSYHGYGETRPVVPNDTINGRARNRRVEIIIVTD